MDMEDALKVLLPLGLTTATLIVILILLVQDPERIIKIRSILAWPFFTLFRWFSKTYIAAEVNSSINHFLKIELYEVSATKDRTLVRVKWVTEPKDPIFHADGQLILRLKEDEDQTRNILNAARTALPNIVCPLFRKNIDATSNNSIDLTVLRKLSEKIGRHGKATFKRYFLDPEMEKDIDLGQSLSDLVELDTHGIFTTIFLNELEFVSEELYANSDGDDYTAELKRFVIFLLGICRRQTHEEIQLDIVSYPFKVSCVLLAIRHRASLYGVRPYLKRVRKEIDKGCESIYIIAFPPAFEFFDQVKTALDAYERVNVEKVIRTTNYFVNEITRRSDFKIMVLTKNDIYTDEVFKSKISANNIVVDQEIEGIVDEVSDEEALINVLGVRAYIKRRECTWNSIVSCHDALTIGQQLAFKVKEIDYQSGNLFLTRRLKSEDPWAIKEFPKLGAICNVNCKCVNGNNLVAYTIEGVEVLIPTQEIDWMDQTPEQIIETVGKDLVVKVIKVDEANHTILGSPRQIDESPWERINKAIPKGTEFNGRVTELKEEFIRVDLGNGMNGIIPKECLANAGHEYKNFQKNVVIGQGIDVYVTKVFIEKRKIRLDLKRNKS